MNGKPEIDLEQAHRHFAAYCFNTAWDFIRKTDRTPEEDEQMIRLAHASVWHWTQRPDCSDRTLSIGYWQLSRVYALVGDASTARRYGELCLLKSDEPFYVGYAHEALARAASVAGDTAKAREHLDEARRQAESIRNAEHRQWLEKDLETVV